jgi:hypothetical protein
LCDEEFEGSQEEAEGGEVMLNTDEYVIYQGIAEEIEEVKEHRVVNHHLGEWARGEIM